MSKLKFIGQACQLNPPIKFTVNTVIGQVDTVRHVKKSTLFCISSSGYKIN